MKATAPTAPGSSRTWSWRSRKILLHRKQNPLQVQHCARCLSVGCWKHFLLLISHHQRVPTRLSPHGSPVPFSITMAHSSVVLLPLPSSASSISSPSEPTTGSLSSEALVAFQDSSSFGPPPPPSESVSQFKSNVLSHPDERDSCPTPNLINANLLSRLPISN